MGNTGVTATKTLEIKIGYRSVPDPQPICIQIGPTLYTLTLEQAEQVSVLIADAVVTYAGIDKHELSKN